MGYLCGVPERFLHKFQGFYFGITVRMRHSSEKRGKHSLAYFREPAATLCSISTITFALGWVSGLTHHVARITNQSQYVCDLPWVRWRN